MKKKYKLIHPYRHHSYHIVRGLLENGYDIEAIYGFYDKYNLNSIFNIKKLKGYYEKDITKVVKTYLSTNIYFILTKLKIISNEKYIEYFQRKAIKEIKKGDTIIFLQDYCQNIINYCIKENIEYIYDHIMPCGNEQRQLLINSMNEVKLSKNYVDKYMSQNKIENNYHNIENASIVFNASNSTYNISSSILSKFNDKNFKIPYGSNFNYFYDNYQAIEHIKNKLKNLEFRSLKVLYVGSLSLVKGTHILIDIIKNIDKCEFGIVGVPNSEYDNIFIEKILNQNNVNYYGAIPHKEMWKIYKEYDVFIFTSLVEGFGMVTLEAMSAGIPCVVNKYCSSIIKNRYNGIIVDDVESKCYIEILKELKKDRKNMERLSINAYKAGKYYTWNKYSREISNILDKG